MAGKSGADLEFERLMYRAGVTNRTGMDGPRLIQVAATNEAFNPAIQESKRMLALRRFRVGLANIATAPCTIFAEGDSILEGYNLAGAGSWSRSDRPMHRLFTELNSRFPVAGASGAGPYLPCSVSLVNGTVIDWPWVTPNGSTFTGNSVGPGLRSLLLFASSSQYAQYTVSGLTKLRIWYGKNSGAGDMRIVLDGSTLTTISQNGVLTDGLTYDVVLPDTGAHIVRIEAATGVIFCSGAEPINGNDTKGWRIIEGGHASAGTKTFTTSSPSDARKVRRDQIAAVQPHLYILEIGANDWANTGDQQVLVDTFKTNVQNMIADVRTACSTPPSIVLVPVWELVPAGSTTATWQDYRKVLYDIALSDEDMVVYDAAQRVRTTYPRDNARGLLSDTAHMSVAGSRMLMSDFAEFLS